MCKVQLKASHAQGFGIVPHSKGRYQEPPSVAPNLLCVCSCAFLTRPLSFVSGRYMHSSVRECVDWGPRAVTGYLPLPPTALCFEKRSFPEPTAHTAFG